MLDNVLSPDRREVPTLGVVGGGDGLAAPRRYWSVLALWLAILVTVLDVAVVSVALPTIARDFDVDASFSIWIVTANHIAITIALLPAAALGEILGYHRVYLFGLFLFVLASLGCVFAGDISTLAIARFLQGIGAAGVMACNGALVRFTYPRALLGRGIGFNALIVAAASAAGPSIAAAIMTIAPWQWLFAINLPFGLLALYVGHRAFPRAPRSDRRFDTTAAILNVFAFGSLFLAFANFAQGGSFLVFTSALALGVVAGIMLIRHSRGHAEPLVPLDLMRIPLLKLSYATSACSFAAVTAAMVSLPFYLHERFGLSVIETGLLITPWPLAVVIAAPLSGYLVERFPSAILGGTGLFVMGLGFLFLALLPDQADHIDIGWRMALCGAGFGFFQTPNNETMLGSAPKERSGSAGGMLAISRLVGQTLGAILVALAFRTTSSATPIPLFLSALLAVGGAMLSVRRLAYPSRVGGEGTC